MSERFFSFPPSFPSSFSNNNQSSVLEGASISVPTIPVSSSLPNPPGRGSSATSGGFSELRSSSGSRKARVLYDYDAASSSELSLLADEVKCCVFALFQIHVFISKLITKKYKYNMNKYLYFSINVHKSIMFCIFYHVNFSLVNDKSLILPGI